MEDGCLSLWTGNPRLEVKIGKEDWEKRLRRFAQAWGTIRETATMPKVVDVSYEKRIIVKQGG
jgi:cell division septal protein FtsQ